jgi:hypothetical protein
MLLEYEAKKVNWKKLFQELESEVRFFLFTLPKTVPTYCPRLFFSTVSANAVPVLMASMRMRSSEWLLERLTANASVATVLFWFQSQHIPTV